MAQSNFQIVFTITTKSICKYTQQALGNPQQVPRPFGVGGFFFGRTCPAFDVLAFPLRFLATIMSSA